VTGLDAETLHALLRDLSSELAREKESAQVFIVGGAAMILAHSADRATHDVDGVFYPTGAVRRAAAAVAERHELPSDWLNDAAKGFLPSMDDAPVPILKTDHLDVQAGSTDYLLATKLFSSRLERDTDDAVTLWREAGYTDPRQGLDLLVRMYGEARLQPRHEYFTQTVAAEARTRPAHQA
jgi:hypothetical protein